MVLSIANNSIKYQPFIYTLLNVKTFQFLFQTIQFSVSTQFSSIWLIDRTLPGATTLDQIGSGSDDNKGVLCITQSSSITGASPSDCLESYTGHSLEESCPFTQKQSVYSTVLPAANWASNNYSSRNSCSSNCSSCCRS